MKIELIMKDGNPVGYKIIPETLEEKETVGTVRDLIFFGFEDTVIKYNGLKLVDGGTKRPEDLVHISFIQKKHHGIKV